MELVKDIALNSIHRHIPNETFPLFLWENISLAQCVQVIAEVCDSFSLAAVSTRATSDCHTLS